MNSCAMEGKDHHLHFRHGHGVLNEMTSQSWEQSRNLLREPQKLLLGRGIARVIFGFP